MRPFAAFTLIELLISLGLFTFLGSLCAFQSIGVYQRAIQSLEQDKQSIEEKAYEGKTYRHIFMDVLPNNSI